MKKIILVLLLASFSAQAQTKDWRIDSGSLQYTLKHMLHTSEGTSTEVKGLGKCDSACSFLIAAPVKTFDSGNSSRDTNMQKFTKAALFPIVEVRTTVLPSEGEKDCELEVKFAGKTHKYPAKLKFAKDGNGFKVSTVIPMNLSDFEIERPSLLGVSVEDLVPVSVGIHISPK